MRLGPLTLASGLLLLPSCFEDSGSNDTGTATATTTGTTDATATDSGSAGSSGTTTGGTSQLCTDYCQLVDDTCTLDKKQYTSTEICEAVCAAMEPGEPGMLGDTAECRKNQAVQATENPDTFCLPAGPTGGDVCGARCQAFCTLAGQLCTGDLEQWPDVPTCISECMMYPTDVPYNSSVTAGDSYACRMYHLTVASLDPDTHCPHIVKDSAVCF